MSAINNLESAVRKQTQQIEEIKKSLINIITTNKHTTILYTRFELLVIVAVVALLEALFLYYK